VQKAKRNVEGGATPALDAEHLREVGGNCLSTGDQVDRSDPRRQD